MSAREARRRRSPNFGFSVPMPGLGHVFGGFQFLGVILVTAIPFGIYDLVEAMDNVESAAVAGDSFPDHARAHRRRRRQPDRLPDGQSVHQRGLHRPSGLEGDGRPHRLLGRDRRHGDRARPGSASSRVMMSLIPVVAISPILLYIGMLIGAQAFQETPQEPRAGDHARAHAAPRGLGQAADRQRARRRRHQRRAPSGSTSSARSACSIDGLAMLGGGSILGGLVLGAIAAFIIDRQFMQGVGVRAGRRGADVLRLHARRGDRHRSNPRGRHQLPRGLGRALCLQ